MIVMAEIFMLKVSSSIEWNKLSSLEGDKHIPSQKKDTLVLGLGNTILTDDGVGIYVTREIGNRIDDEAVEIQEAAVGGLELLNCITGFRKVILIDAVMTGKHKVGTLLRMKPEDFEGGSSTARHQVGRYEALLLGKKLKMDLPKIITIYGIEVNDILTFGETCTPEVSASISKVAKKIIENEFQQ